MNLQHPSDRCSRKNISEWQNLLCEAQQRNGIRHAQMLEVVQVFALL
eukprot:CAMPEP_0204215776 /NCGR_PEP_ID=MMETSP0361-20130328/77683_1 /ASSEMBLY_ACC=CAM_ASM_000343 /TAXON_ID=268821 /ORGANISM="Scrippsiella Hangoei, Strain SHTV-5" /LENGTH=46 /DNA_ID= /DNA_START= /DNA_END= /DNA_ORIENTATION=